MPHRGSRRLSNQQQIAATADHLSAATHFTAEEVKALLYIYDRMEQLGKLDLARFREILVTTLNLTNDVMLDLTFHGFDLDNDGIVNQSEWVKGLSVMTRGTAREIIKFVYYVYDMNGDHSLAREELHHCLKGCIMPGFAVDTDEIEEAEREIVELALKKLDKDRDGQITYGDFEQAVIEDPLLLQACGPCLPSANSMATFLALITEHYREYSPDWGKGFWDSPAQTIFKIRDARSLSTLPTPGPTGSAPARMRAGMDDYDTDTGADDNTHVVTHPHDVVSHITPRSSSISQPQIRPRPAGNTVDEYNTSSVDQSDSNRRKRPVHHSEKHISSGHVGTPLSSNSILRNTTPTAKGKTSYGGKKKNIKHTS